MIIEILTQNLTKFGRRGSNRWYLMAFIALMSSKILAEGIWFRNHLTLFLGNNHAVST